MTNFDRQYLQNIQRIYQTGEDIYSERTGLSTKAIPGLTFELWPAQGFPLLTLRKIPIKIFCAEVVWMLTGEKKLDFMQQFTKIWDDFAEADGTMDTAYGYRWRHHFGRDQLLDAVQHLKDEPSSRQAVIVMWDPASDGLTAPKKKNVPCPFTWVINIINNSFSYILS